MVDGLRGNLFKKHNFKALVKFWGDAFVGTFT